MFWQALRTVFKRPSHTLVAASVAGITFALAMWLPNFALLWTVFSDGSIAVATKLSLAWSLLGSIGTNYTLFSASYTVAISLLFGIYVALLVHYIRTQKKLGGAESGTGLLGVFAGALGLGCAACKTLIITSVFAAVGGAGFLAALPLGGSEFGIIGILLLLWSIYVLLKRIGAPLVCET